MKIGFQNALRLAVLTALLAAALLPAGVASADTLTVCSSGCDFTTVQAAIDGAAAGDTISIAPGTYNEAINVNKFVSLVGSGSDPASGTVLTHTNHVVSVGASGLSETDPLLFKDLCVQTQGNYGFNVGNVSYLRLENVSVLGDGSVHTENEVGLKVATTASLFHLEVVDSRFEALDHGWYFAKHDDWGPGGSMVRYVTVSNTQFVQNSYKGIYAEKLSDAVFTDVLVANNGLKESWNMVWNGGIDINLKGKEAYQNLTFNNLTVTGNGIGYKEGAGLMIKARDDGGIYGLYPATLNNVVIHGGVFTGNERGIRLGEPGKANAGPTNVVIHNASIYGNLPAYTGGDGSAYGGLVNQSVAAVDARGNWWGSSGGPVVTVPPAVGDVYALGAVDTSGYLGAQLREIGETWTLFTRPVISGLYGAQVVLNHDPAVLDFAGGEKFEIGSWFWDTVVEDFKAAGGAVRLSGSMLERPAGANLAGEAIAAFTYRCKAMGTSPVAYDLTPGSGTLFSDQNGFALPVSLQNDALTCEQNTVSLQGLVELQGRRSTSPAPRGWNGAVLKLTCASASCAGYGPYTFAATNAAGEYAWVKTTPGSGIAVGDYAAEVTRRAYLKASTTLAVTTGANTISTPKLLGGDVNDSGAVSLDDLSTIGLAFGQMPLGGADSGADINGDNIINILDLAMAGGNFNKAASAW